MLKKLIFLLILLITLTQIIAKGNPKRCRYRKNLNTSKNVSRILSRTTNSNGRSRIFFPAITVQIVWIVVHSPTVGRLTKAQIDSQITVLNQKYRPASIQFNLKQVIYRQFPADQLPFNDNNNPLYNNLINYGGAKTIKIISQPGLIEVDGSLGYTLGVAYEYFLDNPETIVIDFRTLPGISNNTNFNGGITLVHEIGHWFGMEHVFNDFENPQVGCQIDNDLIADTPLQWRPIYTCVNAQIEINGASCPSQPIPDVTNYMGYAADTCMNRFSRGQIQRMFEMWLTYRENRINGFISVCFERSIYNTVSIRQCFPMGTYRVNPSLNVNGINEAYHQGGNWLSSSGPKNVVVDANMQIDLYSGLGLTGTRTSFTTGSIFRTFTFNNNIRSFKIYRLNTANRFQTVCAFDSINYRGEQNCFTKGTKLGFLDFDPKSIQFGTFLTRIRIFGDDCRSDLPLVTITRSTSNLIRDYPILDGLLLLCMSVE